MRIEDKRLASRQSSPVAKGIANIAEELETEKPSPARIRFALLALALGGFAIGATEFVAMGLLPNLASDLLPHLYAESHERANAQAGWLISA